MESEEAFAVLSFAASVQAALSNIADRLEALEASAERCDPLYRKPDLSEEVKDGFALSRELRDE